MLVFFQGLGKWVFELYYIKLASDYDFGLFGAFL